MTHSAGLWSTKVNITRIINLPTLLIKHQFNWVLRSLLQTVVNYHIYFQKFLTQFLTKLSATTEPTQTLQKHVCASYLYMKHKYDTVIAKQFHMWCSDMAYWYEELGTLFVPTTYSFASHLLVTINRNYNDRQPF